ncbi:MAG: extracellular solute-binding protein [Synechococcaceae bacterium WBB_32_011]|nr:extracellular solute-binding protein [Synechococcaceae bacterium WBB_32_011]
MALDYKHMIKSPMGERFFKFFSVALLPLLGLLAGCEAPLAKQILQNSSQSAEMESAINLLVETRIGADPFDQKLNKLVVEQEVALFKRFNPGVKIDVRFVSDDQLLKQLDFQFSRGLAPDLILLTTNNLLPLWRQGLIKPIELKPFEQKSIRAALLPAFKDNKQLLGLPVFIYPQIACFNRKRLKNPPAEINELIALAQAGYPFGISGNFESLRWLYTGFDPNINKVINGQQSVDLFKSPSLPFLTWLRLANLQPSISFESDQLLLRDGLVAGKFSWITCSGAWLQGLQKRMGSKLGVALLPSFPTGPAQGLLNARTWALGSQSSRAQYELAKKFALFSINVVQQRNMALSLRNAMPVNPGISLPLKTDPTLALIVKAASNGRLLNLQNIYLLNAINPKTKPYLDLVLSGDQSPQTIAPRFDSLLKQSESR